MNFALLAVVRFFGPLTIPVSGGSLSTANVRVTGVVSAFPRGSTERTAKL